MTLRSCYLVCLMLMLLFLATVSTCNPAWGEEWIPDTPQKVDLLADAIFWSEGGKNAKYGIKSIPCDTLKECRRICKNTIRNNVKRWNDSGRKVDYLTFLRNKYAPIGADNDLSNLNSNWLKNVKGFLSNPKKI